MKSICDRPDEARNNLQVLGFLCGRNELFSCLKYIRFLQVCVMINVYEATMAGCGKTEMMAFMKV